MTQYEKDRKEHEVDLTNKDEVINAIITTLAYNEISNEELYEEFGVKDANDLKNHSLDKLVHLLENVALAKENQTEFIPSV